MKRKNLLSGILLLSLSSLSLTALGQNTELTGQLKGISGATVEIGYMKNGMLKTDTVIADKDVFTWKANLNEPTMISLTVDHNSNSFFVGPGHVTLTKSNDPSRSYTITGSPAQDDAEAFGASLEDLATQQNLLFARYGNGTEEDKAILKKKREELYQQRESRTYQFITDHPKSFYSLYMLTAHTTFDADYNKVKSFYDKLDKSVQQSESGKKLAQMLETVKKSQIGTPMKNFTQRDTSGTPVKFNSFKGKYVLVDFWASWCGPCRAENPNVLKAYNAFKDKGFTVVGISLDDKAANWKKAIRDDKMPWTQLSDLKGWKNEVSTDYGIESIPSNMLIDPSGKIIARNLRGAMLEEKLKQLMN